jgi:alkylhydroperoxidase family enzyme
MLCPSSARRLIAHHHAGKGQDLSRNPLVLAKVGCDFVYKSPMPRLHQVPKADAEAPIVKAMYKRLFGDRDPVAEPGTDTGTRGDWWTVFANSPDVLDHACRGFALYAGPDRKIAPALRELGQTRAGWLVGSQFVFSQHCKSCRALGYPEEKIEALKAWQVSDLFDPLERALLAYTDALVQGFGRVDDAVFEALREHLSDEAILEFTYITMMYTMHAVISRALRLEYDERDDPIVEIAAPADYKPENLGRQIGYGQDE